MKKIGLVTSKNSEGGIGVPSAYTDFSSRFGLVVPINALDDRLHDVDILILMGGADVNPERYGGELSWFTQNPNIQMEHWDKKMLPQYVNAGTPIFGICRGFQTLNVHFGGTLTQDISQEYSPKRSDLAHDIVWTDYYNRYADDFKFYKKNEVFKVNSMHHQGFYEAEVGVNVIPLLKHKVYNNIEAFVVKGFSIAAVQWHPEEIFDGFSFNLVRKLLNRKIW